MAETQINIGLRFNADTGQARQQLQNLKQSLLELGNITNISPTTKLNADIHESIAAVAKLRTALEAATNVNTGKLDLTNFNKQLRNTGMDLTKYRTQLSALGPEGQKAFLGLATSIQSAEVPLLTLNKLATSLWTSLARTAKWQISSTAIHAVIGSFQKAYNYAKDLNESLNNIRIVSGQSADQMAKFAVEANKAAKSLGTTTKAYTDASLIYYQQGLADDEVKARTDVTMKMANVIGQSAEQVSQDLTAVWNNFAKGGENLERFADKMVALGASTASSSQEIATGLEKFAAIAETTGLSFDYAAAALATVTAQTRLSAESVGTSFKTIFSRLDSLKLGETLEDGTDLTKYSEALSVVGVNIKDANGELKTMNDILDETMAVWDNLTDDQKVALANTVAGQRQYTQFMALMGNSDFFRKNLKTINESTGALEEQNKIYQESWEATSKKVQASMEEIYNKILDDKFFIGAGKHLADFITMISRVIDSMGGISGVIFTLTTALTSLFSEQISRGIRNITFDIQNLMTHGQKSAQLMEQSAQEVNILAQGSNSLALKTAVDQYNIINTMNKQIVEHQTKLTQEQKNYLSDMINIQKIQSERVNLLAQEAEQLKKNREIAVQGMSERQAEFSDKINNVDFKELQRKNAAARRQITIKKKQIEEAKSPKTASSIEINKFIRKGLGLDKDTKIKKDEQEELLDQYIRNQEKAGIGVHGDKKTQINDNIARAKSYQKDLKADREYTQEKIKNIDELIKKQKELEEEYKKLDQAKKFQQEQEANGLGSWKDNPEQYFNKLGELSEKSAQFKNISNDLTKSVIASGGANTSSLTTEQIDQQQAAYTRFFETLEAGGVSTEELQQQLNALGGAFIKNENESYEQYIERLIKSGTNLNEVYKIITQTAQELSGDTKDYANNLENLIRITIQDEDAQQQFIKELKEIDLESNQAGQKLAELAKNIQLAGQQKKAFDKEVNGIKTFSDYATAITNATRAISSLGMGMSAISGIVQTLNNEDLSFFEKIQQIMISLPMVINGFLTGIKPVIGLMDKLRATQQINNSQLILSTALKEKDTGATYKNAIAQALSAKNTDIDNTKKEINTALEALGIEEKERDVIITGLLSGAIMVETAAEEAEGKTKAKNIILDKLKAKITKELITQYLLMALAIAAVVTVVVVAIKHYEKEAKAAEKAAKAHKAVADAATETAEAYEKLKNTISGFEETAKNLSELTKGTLEYKEALIEANDKAIELIQTNSLLEGVDYHYNDDGLIEINPNSLQQAQKNALQNEMQMQANANRAKAAANSANQTSAITDFARNNLRTWNDSQAIAGNATVGYLAGGVAGYAAVAAAMVKMGTAIGTAITPGLGTIIGAAAGAVIGAAAGGIATAVNGAATKKEKESLKKISDIYSDPTNEKYNDVVKLVSDMKIGKANPEDIAKRLEELGIATGSVATAMANSGKELAEFVETQKAINAENLVLYKTLVRQELSGKTEFEESDYQDAIVNDITRKTFNENSKHYQDVYDEVKKMLVNNEAGLAAEYLKTMYGEDALENYRIKDYFGSNWTLQKKNADNVFETIGNNDGLSQDDVIKAVTERRLLDEALAQLPTTARDLAALGDIFKNIIASNTDLDIDDEKLQEVVSQIVTDYKEGYAINLTDLTFQELEDLKNNVKETDIYFNQLGEDAQKAFSEAIKGAEQAKRDANIMTSANYLDNLEATQAQVFSKAAEMANLTSKEFDLYAKSIQNANKNLKLTETESKHAATDIIKVSKAIADLGEKYTDIKDTLAKIKENPNVLLSPEEVQDLSEIQAILKDWLGVEFTFEEIAEHSGLIEKAMHNSVESIRDLQKEAAKKILVDFDLKDEVKNKFNAFLEELDNLAGENETLEIGAELQLQNTDDFINTINEMVANGEIAADKVEEFFLAAGTALIPDGFQSMEAPPNTTHTVENVTIKRGGQEVENYEQIIDSTSQTTIQVPKYKGVKSLGSGRTQALGENSSSKSSSSKKKKTADSEIERFHESNAELNALTKKMNELSTLKDRAWGGRRIAAIRAEGEALKEYGKVLQKQVDEAYEYLQQDAAKLNAYGAVYTEDGRIANYNELIANAVNTLSDEAYDDFKTTLSNYESALEKYQDGLYAVAENLRNQFDKEIEEITATVEVKLEVDDRQIKYIEWLVGHLEDKAFSQAAIISTASQNYDNVLSKWDTYTAGIHDILSKAGAREEDITNYLNGNVDALLGLDNIDEIIDELEEYTDGLADTYDQLKDLKDLIEQQLSSVYDEWNDKIEYQIGLMEHYDSILAHYKNIVDILGLDFLGLSTKNLIDLSQTQINSSVSMIQTLKARWNAAQEELKTAQTNLQNATSEADQKFWIEEVEKLTQASNELEENFYSSWEDILNKISDLFDTTRERIFKDFEKSISDTFDSFDEMSSLLDQRKTIAAEYVPEYKKIYELNKLNRNLAKEIDKINDVSKTKKLKDLQDEINAKMREGVQLSEYDLEYMQKKYDLRLAEIALEDAQAAKTTVRLQRDSSGNYSYVYTANEEQTNDKFQDYEDKLYALQDTTENYFNTLSESYFQILQDWENALGGLDKNDKNYEQKVNKINTFYQKRMQYITSELNKGLKNNQQLYKNDQEYMNIYYTNQENRQRAFVLNFKDTLVGGILDGFNSIDDATNYITGQMDDALDQLSIAWTDYYNQTEEALQLNGMSFEDFNEKLENIVFGENGINAKISSIAETTKGMAESSKEDYNKAASAVESFQQRVGPKLDDLFQKTNAFTGALIALQEKLLEDYPDPNITVTQTIITQNVNRDMSYEEYKKEQPTQSSQPSQSSTNTDIPDLPPNQSSGQNSNASSFYYVYKNNKVHYVYKVQDPSVMGLLKPAGESPHKPAGGIKTGNVFLCQDCDHIYIDDDSLGLDTINQVVEKIKKYGYEDWTLQGFTTREIQTILESDPLAESWIINNLMKKHNRKSNKSSDTGPISGMLPQKYDTGGYTGNWGVDGRLAILHEKELVLNKQDTENMLSAVNVIRNLSSTLNLPDLASKMNYLPNQISSSYFKDLSKNQEIQQEVHIDASFPGVTAREEIEQAFGELALQAAQYINRYDQ